MVWNFDKSYGGLKELVAVIDHDGAYAYVNPSFCDALGQQQEAWHGQCFDFTTLVDWCVTPCEEDEGGEGQGGENCATSTLLLANKATPTKVIEWFSAQLDDGFTLYTGRLLPDLNNVTDSENSNVADDKMRFLATMSHEMRTPLNGILGMAGLLMDGHLQPNERSYVEAIRDSGSGLLTMINDILDLSKAVSGKVVLDIYSFNLRTTVEGVFELLSTKVMQKEVEVASFIHPDVPRHLLGDEGRLRQVLLNLVGNAVKFTETGGVTLEVYGTVDDKTGMVELKFLIKDTGIGIAPQKLDAIFEEFTQADSSTARKYEGTGLGLAIAKRIVNTMGGDITVESEVNVGSIFSFTINIALEEKPAHASQKIETDDTIVCLIGSPTLRDIFALYFDALHVQEYVMTDNVEDCVAALEQHENTCLVCDVKFATLHGQRLSKLAGRSVILLTPSTRGRLDTFRKIGFDAYLIKPIRQNSLIERISSSADQRMLSALPGVGEDDNQLETSFNILLAEDNPINALLAKSVLENAGHKVTHVMDGQQALDKLELQQFDVFLVDMRMPVLDGIETLKQLRSADTPYQGLPAIALTANSTAKEIELCYDAGANDFVSKPFDPQDLLSRIRNCVEAPSSDEQLKLVADNNL